MNLKAHLKKKLRPKKHTSFFFLITKSCSINLFNKELRIHTYTKTIIVDVIKIELDVLMTENLLENSPIHLLHRVNQCVSDIFIEKMHGENLTPRQFAVLHAVSKKQGLNQTSLVKETGIDRSTLADIIQRMLKKDLLTRKRKEHDARAYSVYLTETGKKLLEDVTPNVQIADEVIVGIIPEDERSAFFSTLHKIIDAFEKSKQKNGESKNQP